MAKTRLKELREARFAKKTTAMRTFRAVAERRGKDVPSDGSLSRMFAFWENDGRPVTDPIYQEAWCEVLGATPEELGFVEETSVSLTLPELGERPRFQSVDRELVDLFEAQTQQYRLLDRRVGAVRMLPQAEAHVTQMEDILRYALPGAHRGAIGSALAEAAALAGWQALDLGDLDKAWRMHEIAKTGAREGEEPIVLAHVMAQQAYVLLDAGRAGDAVALVQHARNRDERKLAPLLRAWLHAAEGEAMAAAGDEAGTRRALDEASRLLPSGPDAELPFLMLDATHLARWRGHCLARLGAAEAVEDLTAALDGMRNGSSVRAETGLRVDLALALTARGDRAEAQQHAKRAAELAGQAGSARQRARIAKLLAG